jgi:hypothetical protein
MSHIFRVRLSQALAEQLAQVCEATRLPVSAAIRACIEHTLSDPQSWQAFERALPYSVVDSRTPQQQAAWHEYEQELQHFDMDTIVRENGLA